MQLAAPRHNKLVWTVALLNSERYVVNQLPVETLLNVARGDELAL